MLNVYWNAGEIRSILLKYVPVGSLFDDGIHRNNDLAFPLFNWHLKLQSLTHAVLPGEVSLPF